MERELLEEPLPTTSRPIQMACLYDNDNADNSGPYSACPSEEFGVSMLMREPSASTIEKPSEPLRITFDAHRAPGRGMRHQDLTSRSVAILNATMEHGGELVKFPTQDRRIQFRIVVRCIGQSHTLSGQST